MVNLQGGGGILCCHSHCLVSIFTGIFAVFDLTIELENGKLLNNAFIGIYWYIAAYLAYLAY